MPKGLSVDVQTRFSDLDPLGHVNNVAFFTYMATAREMFISSTGAGLRGHIVVVHAECHYRHEIAAAVRMVTVEMSVERLGRTSITLLHELRVGELSVATGRAVIVVVGPDRRPRPMTDAERTALS